MSSSSSSPSPAVPSPFEADATTWWSTESGDWDALVSGASPAALPGGSSVWGGMPEVDSKAVARLSPIFEKHYGVPLDPKLIRPGGYHSIGEAARDIEGKHLSRGSAKARTGTKEARP